MGMFDQLKMAQMAQKMLKDMDPEQVKELMSQAQDSKHALEEGVQKAVADEIEKRGLVTREEVAAMIAASRLPDKQ